MMGEVDRYALEQAYAFFHQKEKVYVHSTSEREKDHIEDSISSYVNSMSAVLYSVLSQGNQSFLREHSTFPEDLRRSVSLMEEMLYRKE
ncbi:MAG: hypothetical protein IJ202_07700 [Bacteroidales bacterium]|nr:hypothetical protein [Bacteroidales bacterium]